MFCTLFAQKINYFMNLIQLQKNSQLVSFHSSSLNVYFLFCDDAFDKRHLIDSESNL